MNQVTFTHLIIEPDYMLVSNGGCCYVNISKISDNFIKDYERILGTGVKGNIDKAILKEANSIAFSAINIEYKKYLELYKEAYTYVAFIEEGITSSSFKTILDGYNTTKYKIDTLLSYKSNLGKFRKLISNLV